MQLLLDAETARQGFTLPNPKKHGAISAVFSGIDFTKTGMNNIVVGREDGVVEVLDMEETGTLRTVYRWVVVWVAATVRHGPVRQRGFMPCRRFRRYCTASSWSGGAWRGNGLSSAPAGQFLPAIFW